MTFEKRCFISPEDILSVQFSCAGCGTATIVPLDKLANGDIGLALTNPCRHCRTKTEINQGTQELSDLMEFTLILGRLARALKGRGIKYQLQVECPE